MGMSVGMGMGMGISKRESVSEEVRREEECGCLIQNAECRM